MTTAETSMQITKYPKQDSGGMSYRIRRSQSDETKDLDKALLEAQKAVGKASRDGQNPVGYTYPTAMQITALARPALNDAGLLLEPGPEMYVLPAGNSQVDLSVSFVLRHPESGQWREYPFHLPIVPNSAYPIDKATLGTLTACQKYVLMNLLQIPFEEVEVCSRDDRQDKSQPTHRDTPMPPPADQSPKDLAVAQVKEWVGDLPEDTSWADIVSTCFVAAGHKPPNKREVTATEWQGLELWVRLHRAQGHSYPTAMGKAMEAGNPKRTVTQLADALEKVEALSPPAVS